MCTSLLTVEWHVTRATDVTLVTVHVTNTHDTAREVCLENQLDGPVLPPCRHGVAEAGWDDDGLRRQVPGESRVSVGYACRAPPETPPVDVTDRPAEETGEANDTTPVDRVLRSLGDHAPPPAVVSSEHESILADPPQVPESAAGASPAVGETRPADAPHEVTEERDTSATECQCECPAGNERVAERGGGDETGTTSETETATVDAAADDVSCSIPDTAGSSASPSDSAISVSSNSSNPMSEPVPAPVAAWFNAVEARLTTADRLAGDVAEATPVVASLGGRPGVAVLADTLDADAAALARIAARANELATRADAAEVPDLREPR
jgi:hypothetical protein